MMANIDLDDEFYMDEWELLGPMGSYAESVFKGKSRAADEEVAIKVISLQNQQLRRSCEEDLAEKCEGLSGDRLAAMQESILRKKVMREFTTTNHLSFKHIYTFYGIYSSSESYSAKVLENPGHPAHHKDNTETANRELDNVGPFCFIVMENLSGLDLHAYTPHPLHACSFPALI
jgi:serine/threonine protein kinase